MPITLNHSNIGVQYSTGSNYIIETVKSDLYRRNETVDTIVRDNIQVAPVTPSMYIENGTNNIYAVESYTYSGSANTVDFTRVFTKSTTCDILVVGGGGAGGGNGQGGGGGAGAVIYYEGLTLNGTYNIKTGKGANATLKQNVGDNGADSEFLKVDNTQRFLAKGGGGGGTYNNASGYLPTAGGSGGGGAGNSVGATIVSGNIINGVSVSVLNDNYVNTNFTGNRGINSLNDTGCFGYKGGNETSGGDDSIGAGGGGAGEVGTSTLENQTGNKDIAGNGGSGKKYNISGVEKYYGGGGGGGLRPYPAALTDHGTTSVIGSGGNGGGGNGGGGATVSSNGFDAENGTGGGGGGVGGYTSANFRGGNGGSGIVIIRYLLGTIPATNVLTNEPVVVAPAFTESIRTFIHSGGTEAQTTHTITVGQNTICDILIVGGGGGGGNGDGSSNEPGGGGAGGIVYMINKTLNAGTYKINVGKGGASNTNGNNSTITYSNDNNITFDNIQLIGRGGGKGATTASQTGSDGGSGGGGGHDRTNGGLATQGNTFWNGTSYVAGGYNGGKATAGGRGGGGGGAGEVGSADGDGYGGDGVQVNITGTNTFYAGGGNAFPNRTTTQSDGGGGLVPATGNPINGGNALPNTGSGGAGAYGGAGGVGGSGGSGIVVIKFKSLVGAGILDGITHKRLNFAYTPNYPFIQADNTNLKAWYKFDGNYMDSSPSGFNLTNSGAAIVDGLIVQSLSTDASDFLETSGINLNGKTYSISFWLKFNTAPGTGNIFIFTQSSVYSPGLTVVFQTEGNRFRFSHYGSGNDMDTIGYDIATIIGTSWHHYVITYNNTNIGAEIWVDGVKWNTNISTLTNRFTGGGNFMIAKWQSNPTLSVNGLFEDFRYYDKILTSTEISQLYSIPTTNQYTLNFPVPTLADINNNSNIILRGSYDIALSTTNSLIIPKTGQYIPKPTTFSTSNLSIRYNILNPILDPIGAQWTYNTSNTNVYHMGRVGIGTTSPEYQLDVSGTLNAKAYYFNGVQIGRLSEGMVANVQHLTYTHMEVKNNAGWDAINDDLTTGFVISITPKSNLSKILVNLIAHIGLVSTNDGRWWGIKLYRKIGTADWAEVTGPNGTETGSAANTNGTPVWISNNMGTPGYAGAQAWNNQIINLTGTYLDSPNTTSTVYYTAYWNQRMADNPSVTGELWLNRAANQNDAYRPAPSSSWTVKEIWYG